MRNKNTRKGFTTVELVIVIAVIAILATVLIPTFSNMIEKANLSVDIQNVRNMNVCLATYSITDGNPSDFGKVKEELKEYGYGKDDNFIPKSKGYTISWYTDDKNDSDKSNDISVIVLVDDKNKVAYPEDYKGIDASDIRIFFDLSLPAASILINEDPKKLDSDGKETEDPIMIPIDANFDGNLSGEELLEANKKPLSVMYTFKADEETSTNYNGWVADFYVSVDLPENIEDKLATSGQYVVLSIAGQYDTFGPEWVPITLPFVEDSKNTYPDGVPLLQFVTKAYFTYNNVQSLVNVFNCGVVGDEIDGEDIIDKGIKLTVELRLTEAYLNEGTGKIVPVENGEQKVLGIFEYTYK